MCMILCMLVKSHLDGCHPKTLLTLLGVADEIWWARMSSDHCWTPGFVAAQTIYWGLPFSKSLHRASRPAHCQLELLNDILLGALVLINAYIMMFTLVYGTFCVCANATRIVGGSIAFNAPTSMLYCVPFWSITLINHAYAVRNKKDQPLKIFYWLCLRCLRFDETSFVAGNDHTSQLDLVLDQFGLIHCTLATRPPLSAATMKVRKTSQA